MYLIFEQQQIAQNESILGHVMNISSSWLCCILDHGKFLDYYYYHYYYYDYYYFSYKLHYILIIAHYSCPGQDLHYYCRKGIVLDDKWWIDLFSTSIQQQQHTYTRAIDKEEKGYKILAQWEFN